MDLTGIHHLTAINADAAQTNRFYTETLGLRRVKKTVNQDDTSAYHLFFADGAGSPGTDLTFFDWPVGSETRGTNFSSLAPRDSQAAVRGVTPLELLFDRAAVVAIGVAAAHLSEAFVAGETGAALLGFLCSFFMIWWAWMNYTWFASPMTTGPRCFAS